MEVARAKNNMIVMSILCAIRIVSRATARTWCSVLHMHNYSAEEPQLKKLPSIRETISIVYTQVTS